MSSKLKKKNKWKKGGKVKKRMRNIRNTKRKKEV